MGLSSLPAQPFHDSRGQGRMLPVIPCSRRSQPGWPPPSLTARHRPPGLWGSCLRSAVNKSLRAPAWRMAGRNLRAVGREGALIYSLLAGCQRRRVGLRSREGLDKSVCSKRSRSRLTAPGIQHAAPRLNLGPAGS